MSQTNDIPGFTDLDRPTFEDPVPSPPVSTIGPESFGSDRDKSEGGGRTDVAVKEASNVASTGVDGAKKVASEATAQVKDVAQQAKSQLTDLVGQSKEELRSQAQAKSEQAASGLRRLSEQITALSNGRPAEAGALPTYLDDARRRVVGVAETLEQRGPQGLLEDISSYARRKPGTFLVIAGAAGFAIGRIVRGASGSQEPGHTGTGSYPGSGEHNGRQSMGRGAAGELPPATGTWPEPTPDIYGAPEGRS